MPMPTPSVNLPVAKALTFKAWYLSLSLQDFMGISIHYLFKWTFEHLWFIAIILELKVKDSKVNAPQT